MTLPRCELQPRKHARLLERQSAGPARSPQHSRDLPRRIHIYILYVSSSVRESPGGAYRTRVTVVAPDGSITYEHLNDLLLHVIDRAVRGSLCRPQVHVRRRGRLPHDGEDACHWKEPATAEQAAAAGEDPAAQSYLLDTWSYLLYFSLYLFLGDTNCTGCVRTRQTHRLIDQTRFPHTHMDMDMVPCGLFPSPLPFLSLSHFAFLLSRCGLTHNESRTCRKSNSQDSRTIAAARASPGST